MYIHECAKHACSEGIPFSRCPLGGGEVSRMGSIIFKGLYWDPPLYGNYQVPSIKETGAMSPCTQTASSTGCNTKNLHDFGLYTIIPPCPQRLKALRAREDAPYPPEHLSHTRQAH